MQVSMPMKQLLTRFVSGPCAGIPGVHEPATDDGCFQGPADPTSVNALVPQLRDVLLLRAFQRQSSRPATSVLLNHGHSVISALCGWYPAQRMDLPAASSDPAQLRVRPRDRSETNCEAIRAPANLSRGSTWEAGVQLLSSSGRELVRIAHDAHKSVLLRVSASIHLRYCYLV